MNTSILNNIEANLDMSERLFTIFLHQDTSGEKDANVKIKFLFDMTSESERTSRNILLVETSPCDNNFSLLHIDSFFFSCLPDSMEKVIGR